MKIKNQINIILGSWSKFNLKFSENDIYTGKIMKCTSYYSKMEEASKYGCTDYEGHDIKKIESDFVKNAILVKICYQGSHLYVELDKFDLKKLKKRIKVFADGGANIFIEDDELILLDEPYEVGMEYVDPESIKKLEYSKGNSIDISSRQQKKVKTLVKSFNKKGA